MKKCVLSLCLVLCLLATGLGGDRSPAALVQPPLPEAGSPEEEQPPGEDGEVFRLALAALSQWDSSLPLDRDFLAWGCDQVAPDFAARLAEGLPPEAQEPFYELFGSTLHVLWDRYTGAPVREAGGAEGVVTLAFGGDVNLADNWENMQACRARGGGVEGAISGPLLERMRDADILLVNNEFCFSNRGSPTPGKLYTFRAAPQNAELLREMGVDLVSLANNHVFDYGLQAFCDTLDTLAAADIPYIGAGRDLAEAGRPVYFHAGGMKIAYVAASRAEKYILTPQAAADAPGVLWCYEEEALLAAVATARQNADWVVVYPHWGTEYETGLEPGQEALAQKLVEAGADIVVGAHPHVLQGIAFYQGKPIAYSLGNFWFNVGWVKSAFLEIDLLGPGEYRMRVFPCMTAGGTTALLETQAERRALFDLLEDISQGIAIGEDGAVTPAAQAGGKR